jgi:hypothetical protein
MSLQHLPCFGELGHTEDEGTGRVIENLYIQDKPIREFLKSTK